MLDIQNKVLYKAFGLNVYSEIPLPELPKIDLPKEFIDIEICIKDLKSQWAELDIYIDDIFVKENEVMFLISNIAIFSIQDGNKIFVSPLDDYNEDAARLFLLGTCMGVILLQKKILPLHGSAIVIDGVAYGFVGDSGAGKSTLATAFLNNGYQLLTDDVIAIRLTEEGTPVVTPSYPQQKLWQESLNEFGMGIHQFRPLLDRETKYAVPVSSQYAIESIPLAGIFELIKTTEDEIKILPIQGHKRFYILFYHTYRNFLIAPLGLREWHFHTTSRFINKIDFFQLHRPNSRFTAHELSTHILNIIKEQKRAGN
jgi:hypothetical protein